MERRGHKGHDVGVFWDWTINAKLSGYPQKQLQEKYGNTNTVELR